MSKEESFLSKKNTNDFYANLYFNLLYVQIRNYKEQIILLKGSLNNMHEQCAIGYTNKSLDVNEILRKKLKNISKKFLEINNSILDINITIDEILEIYEGYGIKEVYEADTGKFIN